MNPPKKKFPLLFHNYPSSLVTAIIRALMLSYAQFRTNPKRSHQFLHLPQSYTLNIFSPNDPTNITDLYSEYMRTVVVDIIHILPPHGQETKKFTETESIASLIFDQILAGKDSYGGSDWYEWSDFHKSLKNSHNLTYAVNHPVLLPWRKRLNLIDSLVMKLHSPNTRLKNLIRDVLADMEMFEQDWIDTIRDDAPFMSILNFHPDAADGLEVDTTRSSSKRYIKQRRGIRLLQLIRNSDHHLHDKKPLSEDPTRTEFKHFDRNTHPNYLDKRYICFKFLRYFPKLMPQLCSGLVKYNVKYWEFL